MHRSTWSALRAAWGIPLAAALLVVLLPAAAASAAAGPTVWVADSLHKIRPSATAPSKPQTTVELAAAGNEFESFQIAITGGANQVSVALAGGALTDGVGHSITEVRLYREAMITLRRKSSSDPESDTGAWPDALVPVVDEIDHQPRNAFPFNVRSGTTQPVWVDVFVPPSAPPGLYTGVLTVSVGGKPYTTVTVNLTVWNFQLEPTASASSAYALAWGAIPTGFGIDGASIDAIADLRYKFGVMGLDHRISLSHHDDGNWYDTAHFLKWYGALMDDAQYAAPNAATPRLAHAHLTSLEYMGPPNGGSDVATMQRWADMCADPKNGWMNRLFQYTADEPNPQWNSGWTQVGPKAQIAHAVSPPVRTLVTTDLALSNAQTVAYTVGGTTLQVPGSSVIDVMVPAINSMANGERDSSSLGSPFASYDAFLGYVSGNDTHVLNQPSPGNELWLYQSCMSHDCGGTSASGTGWPSYMIDANAVRNRAMQWLMFSNRATGELYWETGYALYAKRDAWTDQWAYTGNGDGTLFYPGTPAKIGGQSNVPVASIRLKEIRDGMEDFDYLTRLAGFDPDEARYVARAVFPQANATNVNPANLTSHRAYVACLIEVHEGANRTCTRPAVLP